ncbi:MAG: SRPBCC family protein [Actinobacteria bacterium]|nr:SRPBCC family protein [Actinomycetota bacterium]MCL5073743.1 SRPBCC family protein [Actinomycetota bacterium]
MRHYENSILIPASVKDVFDYVDDHTNLSSHMNKSSWMMGGGKMETSIDDKGGKEVGSHIKMSGNVFGIQFYLDEVVIKREPPRLKVWETVGVPKLLVVGNYQMRVEIKPNESGSLLQVSIDYELPLTNAWLGKLFSRFYAKWCVEKMIGSVRENFTPL